MSETAEQIAERAGKPVEEIAARLEDMTERGLLFRLRRGDSPKNGAIPFVHGLFEFQPRNLDRELVEIVEQYHNAGFSLCVITCSTEAMRLVPKPEKEHMTPPATSAEQMMIMARNRGLC